MTMVAIPEQPGCIDCGRSLCTYHQGWRDALNHLEGGHLPGPWARALWHGRDELAATLQRWAWDEVERRDLCQRLRGLADRLMP